MQEEWVVCRVFKKSCSGKIIKPQPSPVHPLLLDRYHSSCNNFNASNLNNFVSATSTIGSQPKPLQLPINCNMNHMHWAVADQQNGAWIQGLLGAAGIVPEMMKTSLPAIHNINVHPPHHHQAQAEAAMSDVASLGSCVAQGDNVSAQEIVWTDY